ncbi:MAG: LLM class F420-dependent oxidoreductase [Mycobacterium sp.]
MTRPIRIGVQLQPGNTPDYASWRSAVLRAEEMGADLILGYDHFHLPLFHDIVNGVPVLDANQPDVNNFEGWTALASWGEITQRAELGLLVSGMGYRNPDLLADMARTVDHITGGRLILGLGAGWYERDYTSYGYEFGTWKTRFDSFDDGLQRVNNRLTQLVPPPVRKIPILIGGSGVKRTLPAVARHADIWHTNLDVEGFRSASAQLDQMAETLGRSGEDIERSVTWWGTGSIDDFLNVGATTLMTEIHPTPDRGYDFSTLEGMILWRDRYR